MRTIVLVLGTRARPYPRLIRTIKRTWAPGEVDDVETLFYFGGGELAVRGPDLVLPVPDDLAHVGHKTIVCFEYLLANREFDVVFRTNCSSYVDRVNLRRHLAASGAPRVFYSGVIGMRGELPFASGSGYFLSRDLVEIVVERQASWRHELPDDAALATLLSSCSVEPVPAPRQDFRRLRDVTDVDTAQFHVRCRTDSWRRREDARIMSRVHRAFCAARRAESR